MNLAQMIQADAQAVAAAVGALTALPDDRLTVALVAVHHAVEAWCARLTLG